MIAKHSNIQAAAFLFIAALGIYYAHIEYGFQMTRPMCAIGGFALLKLWLRQVNTVTYILFHIVLLGGAFLWIRHYWEQATSFDMLNILQQTAAIIGK